MGVDVEMGFSIDRELQTDEQRLLSWRLGEAFNAANFDGPGLNIRQVVGVRQVAGDAVDEQLPDGMVAYYAIANGLSRYYGPGYERGRWPILGMTLRWLAHNLPGEFVLHYGPDSDWGTVPPVITLTDVDQMDVYFFENGHRPYSNSQWDEYPQLCPTCRHPMDQRSTGMGGLHAGYDCDGCGLYRMTTDGGETWEEKRRL